VISIHGGGYVSGTVELDDEIFDHLCTTLHVIGVSIDYRLAPETRYPGPLDDFYRALVWTFAHATELGIDSRAIGVGVPAPAADSRRPSCSSLVIAAGRNLRFSC
jgi:acetyl esterase/lipase